MSATHSPSSPCNDQPTFINHLPAELLSIIFRLTVPVDIKFCFTIYHSRRILCSVCSLWSAIVVSIPELWRFVVGFVDIPDYWRKAGNQIQLSRDLTFTLVLARCNTGSAHDLEGIHVQMMLAHAIPHFQRISYLSIDVHSSSSLPSIKEHFVRRMPRLKILKLQCDHDDGPYQKHNMLDDLINDLSVMPNSPPPEKFSCPHLTLMAVDGANFRYICQERPEWTNDLGWLSYITVSHFTNDVHRLDLNDVEEFLHKRSKIYSLKFVDVDFDYDADHLPIQPSIYIKDLELEDLSGPLYVHFFHNHAQYDIDTLSIKNCRLDGRLVFPLTCHTLNLEGVHDNEHLYSLLRRWNSYTVSFRNCPGFNDAVLETVDENSTHISSVERFENIILIGCSNFSIQALKRMVELRNPTIEIDYTDLDWMGHVEGPELQSVVVHGYGSELSAADRQWFEDHLRKFIWD
jgi:hypothetical protein